MRLRSLAVVVGVLLLVVSFGASALGSPPPDATVERYKYDIYIDKTPFQSPDGPSMPVNDLRPELREIAVDHIKTTSIIDVDTEQTVFLETPTDLASVEYVEYRGLYYRANIQDYGLVEATSLDAVFSWQSVAGAWGMILVALGGLSFLHSGIVARTDTPEESA